MGTASCLRRDLTGVANDGRLLAVCIVGEARLVPRVGRRVGGRRGNSQEWERATRRTSPPCVPRIPRPGSRHPSRQGSGCRVRPLWDPPVVHGVSRWSSHLGADRWPGDAKSYFAAVRSPRARRQWSGVSSWIREAGWSGMRSITSIRYTSGSVP